ncbi:kelch motif family protein, putative [Ichthyophthirius multifiliis]|uniref:Kelch motif family protein, putative n=1 Tax=Ichthyophthirius multifiliis TaxID=5932 RepID=G0QY48_ICHMU|nr:kelch motif family protein, putative [Ichthyophthirius multifiliis]EGR29859.1 kelch motif family protein, putative [Ichthyophthirius multifiliis]|eukprot:XP_004031095.1 kelch motif family protein, putative [Ichthyophthirius multifiliis]
MANKPSEFKLRVIANEHFQSPINQKQSPIQNIVGSFHNIVQENTNLQNSKDYKWSECKIMGNNIQSRSCCSANIYNDSLYIYGGYELSCGILSDFWQIQLKAQQYVWEKVQVKSQINPGKKKGHSTVVYKDKLLLLGGLHQILQSSSQLWAYDFLQSKWSLSLKQALQYNIDSHNSILINNKLYVMFGYLSQIGQYSNAIYSINLDNFQTEELFSLDSKNLKNSPKGRIDSSICSIRNKIYFFGGYTGLARLNDLWYFDLETKLYCQVNLNIIKIILQQLRSGHIIFSLDNYIVLFGGIYIITWELDDIFIFDSEKSIWIQIDQYSARSKECSPLIKLNIDSDSEERTNLKTKRNQKKYNTYASFSPSKRFTKKQQLNINKKSDSLNYLEDQNFEAFNCFSPQHLPSSPTKSVTEQKRKEFNQRKMKMLKNFEIPSDKLSLYRDLSPTSEAIKNTLNGFFIFQQKNIYIQLVIGNPSKNINQFAKSKVCKFNQPLKDQTNLIVGKKPCARDGHKCDFYGKDKLIVFGGDRHKMSFNDIHILDLNLLLQQYKQIISNM